MDSPEMLDSDLVPGGASPESSRETARAAESPGLTQDELLRYARHLVLPEVGLEGQGRLKDAKVLLVGAGGLGSPAALYLAAAGVGTIGIVDFDHVDASNLQRQVVHGTSDVGRLKIDSARDRIAEVNPHVRVVAHSVRLTSENALELLGSYDVVVDGSDNFPTRYLVNDACVLLEKPNVYGSIFRWEGQVSVFAVHGGPCYRCLFREPPPPDLVPSCAEGGVLGVLPGVIGSLQAMETIKLLLGAGNPLVGRLVIFDGLDLSWRELRLRRNPDCPVCGDNPTQTGLIDYDAFCGVGGEVEALRESAAEPVGQTAGSTPRPGQASDGVPHIEAAEVYAAATGPRPPLILDVREGYEWHIANLGELGAVLIPLGELERRAGELPRDRDIVVYCRSGVRSVFAVQMLKELGFGRVLNLRGGILAWADDVDPDMPRY